MRLQRVHRQCLSTELLRSPMHRGHRRSLPSLQNRFGLLRAQRAWWMVLRARYWLLRRWDRSSWSTARLRVRTYPPLVDSTGRFALLFTLMIASYGCCPPNPPQTTQLACPTVQSAHPATSDAGAPIAKNPPSRPPLHLPS